MLRSLFLVFLTASACAAATPAAAQMSATDAVMRLDQIENQMRALTGQVEQLQFRNQQLEQQLRRMQEDNEFRFQQQGGNPAGAAPRAGAPAAQPQMQGRPQQPPMQQQVAPQNYPQGTPQAAPQGAQQPDIYSGPSPIRPVAPRAGRGDVFDPNANPSAPGAPRPLGSLPAGQPSAQPQTQIMTDEPVGARGGREPGAPLDLSTLSGDGAQSQGMPAQQQRGPNLAAVQPTAQSPKEQFDLGYSSIQRKDYGQAEEALREFLRRYPNDRLTADAHYWLGESLYQRQRYQDAAESYLNVTTKFETAAKAPDALLRLGQSLAALGQKEMACASFGEVDRKYPRASLSVKQGVERELKRVRC
jgi:tol-pal system protein YbgF